MLDAIVCKENTTTSASGSYPDCCESNDFRRIKSWRLWPIPSDTGESAFKRFMLPKPPQGRLTEIVEEEILRIREWRQRDAL
jgi:hypothetical protein